MKEPSTSRASPPTNEPAPGRSLSPLFRWAAAPALLALVLLMVSPVGAVPIAGAAGPTALAPPLAAGAHAPAPTLGVPAGAVPFGSVPPPSIDRALPVPTSAVAGVLAGRGAPVAPLSAPQSTASNWFVSNYSTESSITNVGGSNTSLVAATNDQWGILNGTTTLAGWIGLPFSGFFWTHGFSATAVSNDGGKDWNLSWPGTNATWTQSGSASLGSIHFGGGVLASNANGSDVLLADTWGQPCYMFGLGSTVSSPSLCNSTANYTAPLGVAVARSTNGGITWSHVGVVASYSPYKYVVVNLPGCATAAGFLNGNYTAGTPYLALNPTNDHAVLTTTFVKYNYAGKLYCSGGTVYISPTNPDVYTISSYSTDGGFSWTAPQIRSNNQSAYPVQAIGPSPNYRNVMIFEDYINATSTGIPLALASSTTNGTSWSIAADLPIYTLPPRGIAGGTDGYPGGTVPYSIVWDTHAASAHFNTLYFAYADNRSTTTGDPSIVFTRSFNGGTTWSSPVYLTPNTPTTVQYAIPSIAVDPDGRLWLTFYGVSTANGNYYEYGMTSSDAGSTWSPIFTISDAVSLAISSQYYPFGGLAGAVGTGAGGYAIWADCRSAGCVSGGNQYIYVANLNAVSVAATVPGINATIDTLGKSSTVLLNSTVVWERGATVSVQVPTWSPAPGNPDYVYSFANYSGIVATANNPASFTYGGSGSLQANYVLVPAAWITGHVGPAVSQLQVTVNAQPAGLSAFNATLKQFNFTVEAGPAYTVTVSGGSFYVPYTTTVTTSAFTAARVDTVLSKTHGWIAGTVAPANGNVSIDGVAAAVNATTGVFNATAIWGNHTVTGALTGYTSFLQNVSVTPYRTSGVNVVLNGAHIQGTISPVNAVVQVDGAAVTISSGSFSTGVIPGGVHRVTATAPGYSYYGRDITVVPGATATVQITLTNQGWINGTVTPVTAGVQVNGKYEQVHADGSFNVTVTANRAYTVEGLLKGYNNSYANITVTPGNVTFVTLALNKTPTNGGCPNPNNPACNQPPPKNGSTAPQTNWLLYAGIGAVIVVVAAIAVVLLMRRGRGGGSSTTPADEAGSGAGSSYGGTDETSMTGESSPPPPSGSS
jgi:hypothetical protein